MVAFVDVYYERLLQRSEVSSLILPRLSPTYERDMENLYKSIKYISWF